MAADDDDDAGVTAVSRRGLFRSMHAVVTSAEEVMIS